MPSEEVTMLNEDHEVWKQAQKQAHSTLYTKNIADVEGIDLDKQLNDIIEHFKLISSINRYKRTTFASTAPLYMSVERNIPLCTTDDRLAKLWVFQINEILQKVREQVLTVLREQHKNQTNYEKVLDELYSARCVDIVIDPFIGDEDHSIRGMHYLGVVVSHYNSERTGNYVNAKLCEDIYESSMGEEE